MKKLIMGSNFTHFNFIGIKNVIQLSNNYQTIN